MKVLSEIYSGFSLKYLISLITDFNIDEGCMIQWHLVFGLIMLRMISFNMEYKRVKESQLKKEEMLTLVLNSTSDSIIKYHCEKCENNSYCLKFLSDADTNLSDYTFINYIIYVFYPPLYFSGPTLLFNSFIFQINNIGNSQHQKLFVREKIIYILRNIFVIVSFEIFNSFLYVNAYLTNRANSFLLSEFDYYTYAIFCFLLLVFIWFKFTVIWRTTRTWAWIDGVLTEENMNRCMLNNYSIEGFWRAWHRSFNVWLSKYIYIPLGGSRYKIYNIWIVFNFVALWHDLQLNLLIWGWFICLCFVPEIMVKQYFNQEGVNFSIFNKYLNLFTHLFRENILTINSGLD
jgi:D-alanyl-lipoteichoic acid acyltransferase DltB (MBOAT superfamily)